MQSEFEGYAYAIKKILKESQKNSDLKNKMIGILASLIKVPEKYETAIEVALGNAIQNIVTNNEENAKSLINYLKENKLGRATFLPVNSIKPRFLSAENKNMLSVSGCFGIASNLISFNNTIKNVVENLLGTTVIVDTLETAVNMAKNSHFAFKIVTLDGDVISPTGSMTGGSRKSNAVNLISREREINVLATAIQKANEEFANKKEFIKSLTEKLEDAKKQAEELDKKKNSTQLTEAVKIAEMRTEINSLEQDFIRISNQIQEAEKSISLNKLQLENNKKYILTQESNILKLQENNTDIESQQKINSIKQKQESLEKDKAKHQEQLKIIDIKKEQVLQEINRVNDKKYKAETELAKLESDTETMQQRIYEEYELTYDTCKEFKKDGFKMSTALSEIGELKKRNFKTWLC